MADKNAAGISVADQAEYFVDLDDLDLAGVDVDIWEGTAGGTTTVACVTRTITIVTRAVCGSIDCGPPPPGGSY